MCEAFWVTEHVWCFWQNVVWKTGPLVPTEFQLNEQSKGETRENYEQTSVVLSVEEKTQDSMNEGESCSVVSNSLQFHGLYSSWNSPGQNTGVGCLSLLQGIFPTQGLNSGPPHCRWILYQLSDKGSPWFYERDEIQEWGERRDWFWKFKKIF